MLSTDKRPRNYYRARIISQNHIGQKKEEKERREKKQMGTAPLIESWKEAKLMHPWKFPHQQGQQPGQRKKFRVLKENKTTGVKQLKGKQS